MKRNATLAAAAVALSAPVLGHHADTGLDLETVVTFHGTVTEFDWRNPHTYVTVQSAEAGSGHPCLLYTSDAADE